MAADDSRVPPIRIICDTCMTDVEVERIVDKQTPPRLLLKCHGTEELIHEASLPGHGSFNKPKVHVWSNLVNIFTSEDELFMQEKRCVENLISQISDIRLYHRVRRAHGAAPTYFDVDEAIDTLMLFRRDPSVPLPPPPPEPIKTAIEDPIERRNREYLEKLDQVKRNAEKMRARAGKPCKQEPSE